MKKPMQAGQVPARVTSPEGNAFIITAAAGDAITPRKELRFDPAESGRLAGTISRHKLVVIPRL